MNQSGQSQLGTYLRSAREAMGVSLAQAAADTRIVQRYLVALELGEYHHLPGDVYARGFLRNYAQYLNLPIEEVVEMYRAERGSSAPIKVVPAASLPRSRTVFMPSIWAVVLVVTVLVVLGYLALNALGLTAPQSVAQGDTPTPTVATPSPLPTYTPAPTSTNSINNAPVSPLDTPVPAAPSPSATPEAPVVVVVRVVEGQSWMDVSVDGRQAFTPDTRIGGWTETFLAQNEVRIKAGNAAVVEVSFNGGPFTRMSATPGDVVTQIYSPAD